MKSNFVLAATAAVAAFTIAAPSQAATVVAGTFSFNTSASPKITTPNDLTGPTNNLHAYAKNGAAIHTYLDGGAATGIFSFVNDADSYFGSMQGDLPFFSKLGDAPGGPTVTYASPVGGFLTFGGYNFSVSSVQTQNYHIASDSSSITLLLEGTLTAEPSFAAGSVHDDMTGVLSLTLNRTGTDAPNKPAPWSINGAFEADATTSSPAPEPASWAMMLGGFGLVGGAMRSRRTTKIKFA